MIEIAKRPTDQYEAEGFVTIDYTDPVTQKVKERISGKNHVFKDALFCNPAGQDTWCGRYNSAMNAVLMMTDDPNATDPDFPYIVGKTIGYGVEKMGSSGLLRGAWNPSGYIGQTSISAWESKWVYDFTPTQALGAVKTVGMTGQYSVPQNSGIGKYHPSGYYLADPPLLAASYNLKYSTLFDADSIYFCSLAGVVTKVNIFNGATTVIDKSAIVGTNSSDQKNVGRDDETGEFYIFVSSSTSTRRFLYKFSDNTFGTLLSTTPVSAMTMNSSYAPFYVYQGKALIYDNYTVTKAWNFTDNLNAVTINHNTTDYAAISNLLLGNQVSNGYLAMCHKKYVIESGGYRTYDVRIYDISTGSMCAYHTMDNGEGSQPWYALAVSHPLATNKLPWFRRFTDIGGMRPDNSGGGWAYTRYSVPEDAPVRPAGYGMTIAYELKVNW